MAEDLKDLTTPELKAEAKSLGLKGYSKLVKSKLISLIKRALKKTEKKPTTKTKPPVSKPTAKQAGATAKAAAKVTKPPEVDKKKLNEFLRHIRYELGRGIKRVALTVTDPNMVSAIRSKLKPREVTRVDFE